MEALDLDLEEGELELPAEPMHLNMGPSHPAMHGTVRIVLELSGERIVRKIAWDVVPELAERLVKERLDELDKAE